MFLSCKHTDKVKNVNVKYKWYILVDKLNHVPISKFSATVADKWTMDILKI